MKKLKINIPKTWNELTQWQLENIALLLFTHDANRQLDVKIFKILYQVRWWQFLKRAKTRYILRQVPISELRTHFEFLYKKIECTSFPKQLQLKKKIYVPPADREANLTADEFAAAESLHQSFRKTKNIEYLQYLAAVLYTPEVDTENMRPEFSKLKLPYLVTPFKKVKLKTLLAIELVHFGCKNNLVKRFPKVYPKTSGKKTKGTGHGFGKIILEMAKADLSKHEAIKRVNIFTFHEQFQQDIINAKENTTK